MKTRDHKQAADHKTEGSGFNNPQVRENAFPTLPEVDRCLRKIAHFLPHGEADDVMAICCTSIRRAEYRRAVIAMAERIAGMPKTYDTDGQGLEAVAHLHYTCGGWHWYITERDREGWGGEQAFGLTVGHERELGYISIAEITAAAGAELDLFWTPKPLHEIPE